MDASISFSCGPLTFLTFSYALQQQSTVAEIDAVQNVKYYIRKRLFDHWHGNIAGEKKSKQQLQQKKSASGLTRKKPVSRKESTKRRKHQHYDDEDDDDDDEIPTLYQHFMCANDTKIVGKVFEDTKNVFIQSALRSLTLN